MLVKLNATEMTTLRWVCRGLQNKEIAASTHTTEGVVKNSVARLCHGLHLEGRIFLLIWAMQRPVLQSFPAASWVEAWLHKRGCRCAEPYCRSMAPQVIPFPAAVAIEQREVA